VSYRKLQLCIAIAIDMRMFNYMLQPVFAIALSTLKDTLEPTPLAGQPLGLEASSQPVVRFKPPSRPP
jgi:hypothetical protein